MYLLSIILCILSPHIQYVQSTDDIRHLAYTRAIRDFEAALATGDYIRAEQSPNEMRGNSPVQAPMKDFYAKRAEKNLHSLIEFDSKLRIEAQARERAMAQRLNDMMPKFEPVTLPEKDFSLAKFDPLDPFKKF